MKLLCYLGIGCSLLVSQLMAGEADDVKGKVVDAKGKEVKVDFTKKQYFIYYYSKNNPPNPGDKFYTKQLAKLHKKSGKAAIFFCYAGKNEADAKAWQQAHALDTWFPAWKELKKGPFKNKVGGYPWIVIKDATGKVLENGSIHQLWTQKKIKPYLK